MPAWKGNPSNPVPNSVQESIARSEKRVDEMRSLPVRRDTDTQKDNTITLENIDETIAKHLESMQITVVDEGNNVKVPILYGSMEKWVAARRDGFLRDQQGKLQLPALIFQRTASDNDDDIEIFNRYVKYPVIQKHSSKNKYTQFALLTNRNSPVNEVFNITMADHMVLTYQVIVWTEYTPQMNSIIQKLKFNTKDYWGSSRGFRFRVKIDGGMTHTTELSSDEDRVVKTEFNLITHGYILPESYQLLDRQYPTTDKLFTPKKIIIGTEVVASDFDMSVFDKNKEKWRSKVYPNLVKGTEPLSPAITWAGTTDSSAMSTTVSQILGGLRVSKTTAGWDVTTQTSATIPWQHVPSSPEAPGTEGWMAKDESYLYIYTAGSWLRVPLATF